MACFHPLEAWRRNGLIYFAMPGEKYGDFQVPCGQCVGCRLERSRQWAVRCLHESRMHRDSAFVTLTYDDEHVPSDGSLKYSDFKRFMRRVVAKNGPTRFFMCGEYGEQTFRPHYHALLFGIQFTDRYHWRTSDSGSECFRSDGLDRLWNMGSTEFGDVTFESAAYVARYVMKKVTGAKAEEHYQSFDAYTGEISSRVPEFCHMSLRPGIGATWFEKFHKQVFPADRIVVNGVEAKPPRYYYELLKKQNSYHADIVEYERQLARDPAENTPDRLAVREAVSKARLSFKRRS